MAKVKYLLSLQIMTRQSIFDRRNPAGGAAASAPITPATAIHPIETFPTGDRERDSNDWRLVQSSDRH